MINPMKKLFLTICLMLCLPHLQAKKNVLFIIVDDLRPEIGCYGGEAKTPSIDRLAESGTLFERAYCNVPVCGASRASLMTGVRPGRHRFINYYTRADKDAPEAVPMSQAFQQAGYTTISHGKVFHNTKDHHDTWDVFSNPPGNGHWRDYLIQENVEMEKAEDSKGPAYEIYEGEEKYRDEVIADETITELRQLKETGNPFFMAVGFVKPHLPFNAPKKYWDMYDPSEIEIPETCYRDPSFPDAAYHNFGELRGYSGIPRDQILPEDLARTLIHGYYASTSYVDGQIGRVLDELDALGLRENTIVVLCGDHGYNLDEHSLWCKHCNFDHALRVPLIIDAPGEKPGQLVTSLVECVDILPTLAQLTGVEPPKEQLEGNSLVPLLETPEAKTKDFIITKFHDGISIRTDDYLFTEWQRKANGQPCAQTLFNLSNDPKEKVNLVDKPEYETKAAELKQLLEANWGEHFEAPVGSSLN